MQKYILDAQGQPQAVDLVTWAKWFETHDADRVVAKTQVSDEVRVSTIFLGLDHAFTLGAVPVLWETMIFGGPLDEYQERYSSRADAEAGHMAAVMRAGGHV
jgi:hypothetical protein